MENIIIGIYVCLTLEYLIDTYKLLRTDFGFKELRSNAFHLVLIIFSWALIVYNFKMTNL